ncbi:MAG: hypothetical protein J5787_09870 [Alphaproteobacteria bacterium]|nr:hypothetical protein [Alphaproteobacteria bacterium]MBO4644795.1 hypothetical protein [Alphaproteobacteria bacterium]
MKIKRILQTAGLFLLSGCALTHYESLDQKPEEDISVSSNTPAEIWIDGQKIQDSAKEHLLKQTGTDVVTLKADGYHDARIIVYRNQPVKKNVTSHESSMVWTSQELSDVTSNLSDLGADAATTSPTSTVKLVYNIGKFVVDLVAMPFSFTTKFNPFGYYFAYDKNQFYVEMMPLSVSETKVFDAFKLQVKKFVLKNYAGLAKGDGEYLKALVDFSGLTPDDVKKVLASTATPADAADAIADRMTAARVE